MSSHSAHLHGEIDREGLIPSGLDADGGPPLDPDLEFVQVMVESGIIPAVDYLNLHGRSAEPRVLPAHANIAVRYIRELPCGLLVIGTYGRPHTGERIFGSGARAILNRVPSPIFLYH